MFDAGVGDDAVLGSPQPLLQQLVVYGCHGRQHTGPMEMVDEGHFGPGGPFVALIGFERALGFSSWGVAKIASRTPRFRLYVKLPFG